jgi:hypothetical protein
VQYASALCECITVAHCDVYLHMIVDDNGKGYELTPLVAVCVKCHKDHMTLSCMF